MNTGNGETQELDELVLEIAHGVQLIGRGHLVIDQTGPRGKAERSRACLRVCNEVASLHESGQYGPGDPAPGAVQPAPDNGHHGKQHEQGKGQTQRLVFLPHGQHTDEGDGNEDHAVSGVPDDHPEEDREEDQEEHVYIIFPVPRRNADKVEQRIHDVQEFGLYDVSWHPFIILCRIFDQQSHAVLFCALLQLFCFRNRNITKDISNFTGIFHAIAHAGKFQFFRHGLCVCFHPIGSRLQSEDR